MQFIKSQRRNIREGFKDIKLTESQNKELFDELRIFFPKEISTSFENSRGRELIRGLI